MKKIILALLIGTGLFVSLNLLHAQTALVGSINNDLAPVQSAAPDSIVCATAEAQGLPVISYDNLPLCGTYWEVLPNGLMPPLPCPPSDTTLPIYAITGNIFLVDATGGQVAVKPRRLGLQTTQATSSAVNAALESLATSIVNLIAMVQSPPVPLAPAPMMRMSMLSSSLATSYADGNRPYLSNLTASHVFDGSMNVGFDIAGGTNLVPYDILMTTNLSTPSALWNWIGMGYTSNRYAFTSQPGAMALYGLAKPSKTMTVGFGNDAVAQCDVPYGLTNALQVAGGGGHTLVLKRDGTVLSWGWNYYGQTTVPTGLSNAVMIAAGYYHSVALLTNGSVVAWGLNSPFYGYPLTQVPSNLTNATVISSLSTHTMALSSNGTVTVWGYDQGSGVTAVPAGLTNVTAIAAGGNHCLAVSNGLVVAWGSDLNHQCDVPAGLSNVVDVAGGAYHSLALKSDGTVAAWGRATETTVPFGLSNVVAIAAGGDTSLGLGYSLALKNDGSVVAWGDNPATDPVVGLSNVIGIAAGADHALALRTGSPTPVITLEPLDEYQVQGSSATFTARGAGLYGVTYQWQTNGVNLLGATSATLTLTNVQPPAQLASYRVVVGNEVGSIVSSNAYLDFVTPPVITSMTMPTNQMAIYLTNLVLRVVADAPGIYDGFPLSYQWQFNGSNLAGATGSAYTIHATATASGTYSVLVSNAAGSTNAAWQVMVYYPGGLSITQQPTNQYQIAGGTINFSGSAIGSNSVAYQWTFNGTNLTGATNALLTLTNVSASQQGYYNFVASSAGNSLTSSNAYFYLVTPPTITSQTTPTNFVCIYGNYLSFAAMATAPYQANGFPISYCWRLNGTNITGATTTNYSFTVNDTNGGIYSLIASNAAGSTNVSWQVTVTNVINVTNDLLLIYNANSADSSNLCAYYLAHRPMVGGANVLGLACDKGEFFTNTTDWDTQLVNPMLNWLTNNPAKRPQYVILFYDIPTRLWLTNEFGCGEVLPQYSSIYTGSVSYHLQNSYPGWKPFVNHINAANLADCEAYVEKIAAFGSNYSPGQLVISASAGNYGNTNYVLDNARHGAGYAYPYGDGDFTTAGSTVSNALTGLTANGVSINAIIYNDGLDTNGVAGYTASNATQITNATNVAGYMCWGEHSALGETYAINTNVVWTGHSSWWIIETVESFNGMRGGCNQGNFFQWFSSNAFGGTNYSNTPIGAVSHTEEPQLFGVENSATYFGLWAAGKNFAICAWASRNTHFFQAIGDPFLTK